METTLGGERLGSGGKQKVHMRNYERSSHDLSYVWRSSMASGTLVPFMKEVGLPGDSFDIDLNCEVLTLPTIGPLFGSFKVQLDVFTIPVRLYNGALMQNTLNIGLKMNTVWFPQLELDALQPPRNSRDLDNSQINPSCIFSYLDIRGLGTSADTTGQGGAEIYRTFNATPYLAYWDIYKNYYANKQEEIGAVIHNSIQYVDGDAVIEGVFVSQNNNTYSISQEQQPNVGDPNWFQLLQAINCTIPFDANSGLQADNIYMWVRLGTNPAWNLISITQLWANIQLETGGTFDNFVCSNWIYGIGGIHSQVAIGGWWYILDTEDYNQIPQIETFPLTNIDRMREIIMENGITGLPIIINRESPSLPPYTLPIERTSYEVGEDTLYLYSKLSNQEGLALKTYQSDLFNNWISTEWIDGDNGINAITSIDTSNGSFTIDTLNLSKKIYDMLNRVAISGGSYDNWLDATYTHQRVREVQNPIYVGGLSKELVFQEVVSTVETDSQALGTLAGKGRMSNKHKGGKIYIKIDEPSYIMGIVSLTPRIDYSQGNKWDVNLRTLDDLHKPALDEIGFQDLVTDQMAWWDTTYEGDGSTTFHSAGKQPAWMNYMTNVNQVKGNFAIQSQEMFMTLTRRYEPMYGDAEEDNARIKDLTTYIDPSKFNHIFADTRLDAQNFWCQIGVDIFARRKMSARIIPNL